jgi:hypothetical protein
LNVFPGSENVLQIHLPILEASSKYPTFYLPVDASYISNNTYISEYEQYLYITICDEREYRNKLNGSIDLVEQVRSHLTHDFNGPLAELNFILKQP